jgi:hypothetical protein
MSSLRIVIVAVARVTFTAERIASAAVMTLGRRLLRPFVRPILSRLDNLAQRDDTLTEQLATLTDRVAALEPAGEEPATPWSLAGEIRRRTGGQVFSGPFSGLQLSERVSWAPAESQIALLVGCYEQELHDAVEELVDLAPPQIVNIGCGEGYYAVGLARRLPSSTVNAVDTDPAALEICMATARTNGVADRLCTMTPSDFETTELPPGTAWFVDCEGAEVIYLDPTRRPDLATSMIIVECHDFVDRSITPMLTDRFSPTHTVELIEQSARNPSGSPLLRDLPETHRWQAVDEGRPEVMNWLVLRPRSG